MDIANQNNELRQYIFETADTRSFPTINLVLMRAHPIYKDETILSDRNVYILCLDAGYTIYEKIEDTKKTVGGGSNNDDDSDNDDDDDDCIEMKKIADFNQYDPKLRNYQKYPFIKRYFFDENLAHQMVTSSNLKKMFNNKHDFLREFAYKCNTRFRCYVCNQLTVEKCIPSNTVIEIKKVISLLINDDDDAGDNVVKLSSFYTILGN